MDPRATASGDVAVPSPTRRSRAGIALALTWVVLQLAAGTSAQGSPSGDYGTLPLGGSVEGVLAPIATQDGLVYHAYAVSVPRDAGAVTVRVEGFGSDIDLAIKVGAPITDYADVDHLDVSDDPDPSHTLSVPGGGMLYIDVLNLLPATARYRLTVSATAAAATGANPLAPPPADPFGARADPLLGTFEGDGLRIVLTGGAGSYTGEIAVSGQAFPFRAVGGPTRIDGTFISGGSEFAFAAELRGDDLTLASGGATYLLQRQGGGPANPLAGGSPAAPSTRAADPVIATGAFGTLTQDNALAFLEALEFSLAQTGYAYAVSPAERQQLLQLLAQNYATLEAHEQAVLAQAREVWTRVQANWGSASVVEREEFVLGVFVLAYGEEAVRQAIGGGSAGARGSNAVGGSQGLGCTTVDECASRFAPEAYQDTMNAQGCWASAGCTGYDSQFNTFTFDSYD